MSPLLPFLPWPSTMYILWAGFILFWVYVWYRIYRGGHDE